MDAELRHVLFEVGIGGSSHRALLAEGIRTLSALTEAREQIAQGCVDLSSHHKSKLLAVINWRVANPDVEVERSFVESSIEEISSSTIDKEWNHICNIVGIPQGSRQKLEEEGVKTLKELLEFQPKLESDCYNSDIWKDVINGASGAVVEVEENWLDSWREAKQKLLTAIKWKQQNEGADIMKEFTAKAYETMFWSQRFVNVYIDKVLGKPYDPDKQLKLLNTFRKQESLLDDVVKKCQDTIMASSILREQCSNFDYNTFIDKAIRHLHSLNVDPDGDLLEKLMVIAGRTQSGKSASKGVIQSLAGMLKLPLIILTKGVDESIDLHMKLVKLAVGTKMQSQHIVVASSKGDGLGYRIKNRDIRHALEGKANGGTLVIADTHAQVVNKACKAIKEYREKAPGGKFLVVVDEADAMFRTKNGNQVFEQALQQLLNLGPCMRIMISATPIPFMLKLVSHGHERDSIDFFNLERRHEYVGIEDQRPLHIDGEEVFLEHDELNKSSAIPYTNDKVLGLYNDAVSRRAGTKGVLLLDISSPYVTAPGNVKVKAEAVQRELLNDRGVDIVVVNITASGLSYKVPGKKWDHEKHRKSTVGKLLNYIDKVYGLAMPVFIFGYSKMRRGISFRSAKRVPTHMVMSLGKGHNCSTIVQTAGRASFIGRIILNNNGFTSVTVLMPRSDYTVIVNYQRYIDHVDKRIQCGDTFAEAMTGANELVPDAANFLRETFRELGAIKGERHEYLDLVRHEEPKGLSANEKAIRTKFWDDEDAQKLLRSIVRLQKGHPQFNVQDAIEDLEEAEDTKLTKKKVNAILSKFCSSALIGKDRIDGDHWFFITNANRNRLVHFMNPEFGWYPDDDALEFDSSDDENDTSIEPQSESEARAVTESNSESDVSNNLASRTPQNNQRKTRAKSGVVVTPQSVELKARGDDESNFSDIETSHHLYEAKQKHITQHRKRNANHSLESFSKKHKSEVNIIQRIAKIYDDSQIYYGDVVGKYTSAKRWWIQFDDGVNEDFDEDELQDGISLYKDHQSKDYPEISKARAKRYCNGGIPMVAREEKFITGECIALSNGKRVHYTCRGDTPTGIAEKYKIDVKELLRLNKQRADYEHIKEKSTFHVNSAFVLPSNCATPPATEGTCDCPIELSDDEDEGDEPVKVSIKSKKRKAVVKATVSPSKMQLISKQSTAIQLPDPTPTNNAKLQRIAKYSNGASSSALLFGDVVAQYDGVKKWWIQWDSELNEDFDHVQLQEGLSLYNTHKKKDDARQASVARGRRYGKGNIPMVYCEDSFEGKCIAQSNLNRRVYYAGHGDTLKSIAGKFGVDVKELTEMNKQREGYRGINGKSEFNVNSPILLPL